MIKELFDTLKHVDGIVSFHHYFSVLTASAMFKKNVIIMFVFICILLHVYYQCLLLFSQVLQ